MHTYAEHRAAVTAVKICGDVVCSASQDGSVRLAACLRRAYELTWVAAPAQPAPPAAGLGKAAALAKSSRRPAAAAAGSEPEAETFDDGEEEDEGDEEAEALAEDEGGGGGSGGSAAAATAAPATAAAEEDYGGGGGGSLRAPMAMSQVLGRGGSARLAASVRLTGLAGPVTALLNSIG